jgi:hypothetical protein
MLGFQRAILERLTYLVDTNMNTQNDYADAVNAIRRRTYIQTKLDLLDKIISRGDASRLVSEIIANERLACKTEGESVSRTMCNLEAVR